MNVVNVSKWNIDKHIIAKLSLINTFIYTLGLSLYDAFYISFYDKQSKRFYRDDFFENLKKIVWNCLPIATLTVSASAFVYSIHAAPEFSKRGLTGYLGGLVALALVRESVPVMGSLAIISQYCSGMTAQIASMKVTEQLDAMKIAKVYPVSYLLVPMLLAGFIGFPIIVLISILTGLVVNYFSSSLLIDINYNLYLSSIFKSIAVKDIFLSLIKASAFGFTVSLVSYVCGILTVGGSKAVGSATRLSVVINFTLVIVLDYIITALWI